jgi:response regulator of citrate/malate metabolism
MNRWRVIVTAADPDFARLQWRYLSEQPGFEVVWVTSEHERALTAARSLKPHLLMLDLELPGGGLALLHTLRFEGRPVEAIAMAASADAETVHAALRLGAVDYLVKPFELERLRVALGTFRRRMAAAAPGRRLTQEEIDGLTRGRAGRWLPRDVEPQRLEQVRAALRVHGDSVTADAIAEAIGVARTTARRYLEYLVTIGDATVEQLPAGPGRPPKAYSPRTWAAAGGAIAV